MPGPGRESTLLEALIEGELAVSETYRQALERLGAGPAAELRRIQDEHRQAASALRSRCRPGAPSPSSAWTAWPGAVDAGSESGGPDGALRALMDGEEREAREYEAALECAALDEGCRRLIADQLLPQARAHLAALARLLP